MSIELNGTSGIQFNDGSDQSTAATPYGRKNLIINGDMRIAQRGTSSTGITTSGYFTIDRYKLGNSLVGTWTQSQDTDVPSGQGFSNSLKMQCTTANASLSASSYHILSQRFEGQNLQHLKYGTSSAESLTLSFWVKSNKTGTYIVGLMNNDASNKHINKSYTINSADTWEKKTITYEGDTASGLDNDNGAALDLNFWLAAGTTFSSGTLQTAWGSLVNANRAVGQVNLSDSTSNYINITGCQLEIGDSASTFEFIPYDMELARCQRYYWKWTGESPSGYAAFAAGHVYSSTEVRTALVYPCTMRAIPAVGISGIISINSGATTATTSGISASYAGFNSSLVQFTSPTGLTLGDGAIMHTSNGTDAYIYGNAEL